MEVGAKRAKTSYKRNKDMSGHDGKTLKKVGDAVDLNIDKLYDMEEEVKVIAKSSIFLLFQERIKNYCCIVIH